MRDAGEHLRRLFPYLPKQPRCNKLLRRLAATLSWLIGALARDTSVWSDNVWVVDSTPVESAPNPVRRSDAQTLPGRPNTVTAYAIPATSGDCACTWERPCTGWKALPMPRVRDPLPGRTNGALTAPGPANASAREVSAPVARRRSPSGNSPKRPTRANHCPRPARLSIIEEASTVRGKAHSRESLAFRLRSPRQTPLLLLIERPPLRIGTSSRQAHQEDVPTSRTDTQNVFLCRCEDVTRTRVSNFCAEDASLLL
jgi:hypothetical protein